MKYFKLNEQCLVYIDHFWTNNECIDPEWCHHAIKVQYFARGLLFLYVWNNKMQRWMRVKHQLLKRLFDRPKQEVSKLEVVLMCGSIC